MQQNMAHFLSKAPCFENKSLLAIHTAAKCMKIIHSTALLLHHFEYINGGHCS